MTIVRLGSVDGALSSSPAETELEAEKIFFRKHILREIVFFFTSLLDNAPNYLPVGCVI